METWKEHDLGNDLETARNNLNEVNFEEGINILALQPGVGKTHKIINYLQENENWLVTVPNYDLINSEYIEISKLSGVKYWKGFARGGCLKYEKGSYVENLHTKKGLNPSIICKIVCNPSDHEKCRYKKQFKEHKNVVAVSSFYDAPYFYEKGKFKFDIAIIDEELKGYDELNLDLEEIDEIIETIFSHIGYPGDCPECDYRDEFMRILKERRYYDDDFELEKGNLYFYGIEDDQKAAIKVAIERGKLEDVKIMRKLNVNKLKKWLYYYSIYGEDRIYAEPSIYKLFDLARQGVKVIFSDASFSKKVFNKLLERYKFEDSKIPRSKLLNKFYNTEKGMEEVEPPKLSDNFKINYYKSNIQNKDVKIYRMWKTSKFYRHYIPEDIPKFIKRSRRHYSNIGIISYLKLEHRTYDFSCFGDFLHFSGLRGTNKFKDKEAIFIIGTPMVGTDNLKKDYNLLFNEDISEIPKVNLDSPEEEELNGIEYQRYLVNSEIYQAVHRVRPFEGSKTEIFVFGHLLNKIKDEFNVVELRKENTKKYFDVNFKNVFPVPLVGSITSYCMKNPELKPNDVAKEFKLYKDSSKKSYNTKIITAIRNGKLNVKNAPKINKLVLEYANSTNDLKELFKLANIDDEIIKSFIHYAKDGSFIKLKNW